MILKKKEKEVEVKKNKLVSIENGVVEIGMRDIGAWKCNKKYVGGDMGGRIRMEKKHRLLWRWSTCNPTCVTCKSQPY